MGDSRADQLKKLLIKFRKQYTVSGTGQGSEDLDDFTKLLDLNSQLATPKSLCVTCWCMVSEAQSRDHRTIH